MLIELERQQRVLHYLKNMYKVRHTLIFTLDDETSFDSQDQIAKTLAGITGSQVKNDKGLTAISQGTYDDKEVDKYIDETLRPSIKASLVAIFKDLLSDAKHKNTWKTQRTNFSALHKKRGIAILILINMRTDESILGFTVDADKLIKSGQGPRIDMIKLTGNRLTVKYSCCIDLH